VRLENGLEKLKGTSSQVEDLKAKLAAQEQELAVKNDEANKLIQVVGAETEKVNRTRKCLYFNVVHSFLVTCHV